MKGVILLQVLAVSRGTGVRLDPSSVGSTRFYGASQACGTVVHAIACKLLLLKSDANDAHLPAIPAEHRETHSVKSVAIGYIAESFAPARNTLETLVLPAGYCYRSERFLNQLSPMEKLRHRRSKFRFHTAESLSPATRSWG